MELDFSSETQNADNKKAKIKYSESNFENKSQIREELKDQIVSLFATKSSSSVDYNSMAPNQIDKIL